MGSHVLQITSRSGVVYTGQLHSIDTKHLTVTLKKVQILCQSNVHQLSNAGILKFDYVIFRGSDIGDVKLCMRAGKDVLAAPEDNAIVGFNDNSERKLITYFSSSASESTKNTDECIKLQDPAIAKICRMNDIEVTTKCQVQINEIGRRESRKTARKICSEIVLPPTSDGNIYNPSLDIHHVIKQEEISTICMDGDTKTSELKSRRIRSSDAGRCPVVSLSPKMKRSISWNFQKPLRDDVEKTNEFTGPKGDTEESLWSENGDKKEAPNNAAAYDRQRSFFDDFTTGPYRSRSSRQENSTPRAGTVNLNVKVNRDQDPRYLRKPVGLSSFPHSSYPNFSMQSAHYFPYETAIAAQGEWLIYPNCNTAYRFPPEYHQNFTESVYRATDLHTFDRVYYPGV
ncbi:hypothetical protein FBUS_04364 [Fasciolopsis buskii]|uniref:Lsm14-like N-terminal domain-containing protein n=1 Tax=Fasciolopsis buskii TaxID=27845 RepID=A0A8E0RPV7_9TREM|nr:hypothetical protein FBUS_04364 [Fasciolopsis buski]